MLGFGGGELPAARRHCAAEAAHEPVGDQGAAFAGGAQFAVQHALGYLEAVGLAEDDEDEHQP